MAKTFLWSLRELLVTFLLCFVAAVIFAFATESPAFGLITLLLYIPLTLWSGIHVLEVDGKQFRINSMLSSLLGKTPKLLDLTEPFDLRLSRGTTSSEPLLELFLLAVFPSLNQITILDKNNKSIYTLSQVHVTKFLPSLYPFIYDQSQNTDDNPGSLRSTVQKMKKSENSETKGPWIKLLKKSGINSV